MVRKREAPSKGHASRKPGGRNACKSGCRGRNGKIKRMQCQGYCWKCFKLRFPKVAKEMREKRAMQEKSHTCAHCATARRQITHPHTKLRYCRACYRTQFPQLAADVGLHRSKKEGRSLEVPPDDVPPDDVPPEDSAGCVYCLSQSSDAGLRACTFTESACKRQVRICDACVDVAGAVVCLGCYTRCWRGGKCLRCKAPSGALEPDRWGRYCEDCYRGSGMKDGRYHGRCYYCGGRADDVELRQCTYAGSACSRDVHVCSMCVSFHAGIVCGTCYQREWRGKCFLCKTGQAKFARFSEPYGRYCIDCYHLRQESDHDSSKRCSLCGVEDDTVAVSQCGHDPERCRRRVALCAACSSLHGVAVCVRCWRRDWHGKCFKCKKESCRWGSLGKFCKACYARHTRVGRECVLAQEAIAYKESLRKPLVISGEEPALQLLVLPRATKSGKLPEYSREARFLSPVHCRLCLEGVGCGSSGGGCPQSNVVGSVRKALFFFVNF